MGILVAKQAPDFVAPAVLANGTITEQFKLSEHRGRYVVLFFLPLDFTFVCPSEIIAHDRWMARFSDLDVDVVGVSVDSQFTEEHGEVCPAGWQRGDAGMAASHEGVADYLNKYAEAL